MKLPLLSLPFLLFACARQQSPPSLATVTSAAEGGSAATAYLFDDMAPPRSYHLDVKPEDWAWLQEHATDEEYVPATVVFEGEEYPDAAVRFKGAFGSLIACFDPTGAQTCEKLSIKVSFNEYDPDGRFFGLRKLIFNSCNRDDSCLRERLGYALFREAGIIAPRAVHSLLSVNDDPESLFVLVEAVDKEFLQDHFENPDGNLYKEAWPRSLDQYFYENQLKSQKGDAMPDVSHLLSFAQAMHDTGTDEFNAVADAYIDREVMTRYLSVDAMMNNWDGITKLYCSPGGFCTNHNFYLYDDPATGRFVVIPWDLDHTWNVPNEDMARSWWNDDPAVCDIQEANALVSILAPQCDPLLDGLLLAPGNWDAFTARLASYTEDGGILSVVHQHELLDRYRAMILEAVSADPKFPPASTWRSAASQLREIVTAQHAEGLAVIEWEPPE